MSPKRNDLTVRVSYGWTPAEPDPARPARSYLRLEPDRTVRVRIARPGRRLVLGLVALVAATAGLAWLGHALSVLQMPGVHVALQDTPVHVRYGGLGVLACFALAWWRYVPVRSVLRRAGATCAAMAVFLAALPLG